MTGIIRHLLCIFVWSLIKLSCYLVIFNHLLYHLLRDCPKKEQRLLIGLAYCSLLLFVKNVPNYSSQHEPRESKGKGGKGKALTEFGLVDDMFPTPGKIRSPSQSICTRCSSVGWIYAWNEWIFWEKSDLLHHTASHSLVPQREQTMECKLTYMWQVNLYVRTKSG